MIDEHGFGGISWEARSTMGELRGVIDPADTRGRRCTYIDRLEKTALERFLRRGKFHFSRAIDFGCGTGRFFPLLKRFCDELYALDRTPAMVDAARRYNGNLTTSLACWTEEQSPYPSEFFDFAWSSSVLSICTPELMRHTVAEVFRICKPGALFALIEQVSNERGPTPGGYAKLLDDAGFEVFTAHAIRSGTSQFIRLAQRYDLPHVLQQCLASAEIVRMRRRIYGPHTPGYFDYFVAARRRVTS